MKSINDILKEFGLELPADKKEAFDAEFLKNYKTVNEVEALQNKLSNSETTNKELKEQYDTEIRNRDTDLKDLQKKLKAAQESSADAEQMQKLEEDLKALRSTYDESKKTYEEKLSRQAHEFLVREAAGGIKFTSNSAKKAFIADALAEETICNKDGKLTGFDDFVMSYKETDADAFVAEEPEQNTQAQAPPQQFSGKSNGQSNVEETPFVYPTLL